VLAPNPKGPLSESLERRKRVDPEGLERNEKPPTTGGPPTWYVMIRALGISLCQRCCMSKSKAKTCANNENNHSDGGENASRHRREEKKSAKARLRRRHPTQSQEKLRLGKEKGW